MPHPGSSAAPHRALAPSAPQNARDEDWRRRIERRCHNKPEAIDYPPSVRPETKLSMTNRIRSPRAVPARMPDRAKPCSRAPQDLPSPRCALSGLGHHGRGRGEWGVTLVLAGLMVLALPGCTTSHGKRVGYRYNPDYGVASPQFEQTLMGQASGLIPGNRARLLNNGDAFFPAMLEAIRTPGTA